MRSAAQILVLMSLFAGFCQSAIAASSATYVITNDNGISNSASVYLLDTVAGTLTQIAVLKTGGKGLDTELPSDSQQAITPDGGCIFILDPGSRDIASFSKATGYAKVGNYVTKSVAVNGSIGLTPNGKFLYQTGDDSGNVGAYTVNSDCSITFIDAYTPLYGPTPLAALKVSPNGKYLIVGPIGELFAIDESSGTLTDLGYIDFKVIPYCENVGCSADGIDFTKDSQFAIFGGHNSIPQPEAFTARITPSGFVDPKAWPLPNSENLWGEALPFLDAAGYAGNGNLYLGAVGGGSAINPGGIITASFTENPLNIAVTNATIIDSPSFWDGSIAVNGNLLVVAEHPNEIGVFSINSDGSLTQLSTTVDPRSKLGFYSLSVFPNTR